MRSSLDGFYETLTVEHFSGIEAVALDMWDPYIASPARAIATTPTLEPTALVVRKRSVRVPTL